jgi:hypothetical protein
MFWLACVVCFCAVFVWHFYRIWKVWLPAEGVVEEQGRDEQREPTRVIRILDGPHTNASSVMYLGEYAQPSELPIGTTVSVMVSPDASTCAEPVTSRFMFYLLAGCVLVCTLPVTVLSWLSSPANAARLANWLSSLAK